MTWDAGAAVSFLVGLVTIRLATRPQVLFYVKPEMRVPLVAAGVILVAFGIGSLWRRMRAARHPERSLEPGVDEATQPSLEIPRDEVVGDHGHGHGRGTGATIGWAVLAPLAAMLLVAPAPLGAFAADREPSRPPPPQSVDPVFAPLPEVRDGAVDMSLKDFIVQAFYDQDQGLEGVKVRLVGFVTNRKAGGFYLTRFTLSCCAADGRPLKVAVVTDGAPPPVETWVEVVGTWVPKASPEPTVERLPDVELVPESITRIAAPDRPYE